MARKPKTGPASDPELLILSSLASGPKHGYAIMGDIEAFAGVTLGPGTLYTAITRLVEKKLIAPQAGASHATAVQAYRRRRDWLDRTTQRHAPRGRCRVTEAAARMKNWIIQALLHLYPASWRREYGAELADMLLARPLTAKVIGDVLFSGLRQRINATEPSTLLGLVMMLVVAIGIVRNMSIVSPQTSNLYVLILVAGGAWTQLRHGGRLSRSGRAAVRIAFIAGIPVLFAALLMLLGVPLQMPGIHSGQDFCWIRVSQPSTQWLARAIQTVTCPPAPLGVLFSPLFLLPSAWLWGLAGGALGRRIARLSATA